MKFNQKNLCEIERSSLCHFKSQGYGGKLFFFSVKCVLFLCVYQLSRRNENKHCPHSLLCLCLIYKK